jgi:hypothetical protein
MLKNLEQVCLGPQVGIEKVRTTGERMRAYAAQMAAAAKA